MGEAQKISGFSDRGPFPLRRDAASSLRVRPGYARRDSWSRRTRLQPSDPNSQAAVEAAKRMNFSPPGAAGERASSSTSSLSSRNLSLRNKLNGGPRVKSSPDRLGRRRLEGHPSADGRGQNAQRPAPGRKRRHGADRHAASAALADAVDFHRHRQAAVQAWHPRLLRAHSGWPRRAAGHQPLAKIESAVEHSQSERSAQHRDRLVAQPSRRADQRRDGFRSLPPRQRPAR